MFAWLKKHRESILTTLGILTASAVSLVTGRASWLHIVHVGLMVGEPSAAWLPVAIDGMVITGTVMAAVDRLRGYKPRFWAIVALWWGAVLTLVFNVASALARGLWAMTIAVLFATAFIVSVEAVMRPSSRLLVNKMERVRVRESVSDTEPVPVAQTFESGTDKPATTQAPKRRGRKPGQPQQQSRHRTPPRATVKASTADKPVAESVPAEESKDAGIRVTVVSDAPASAPADAIGEVQPEAVAVTESTATARHDTVNV